MAIVEASSGPTQHCGQDGGAGGGVAGARERWCDDRDERGAGRTLAQVANREKVRY